MWGLGYVKPTIAKLPTCCLACLVTIERPLVSTWKMEWIYCVIEPMSVLRLRG